MSDPLARLTELSEQHAVNRRAAAEACRDHLQLHFTDDQRAHMNAVLDRFGGRVEVAGVGTIARRAKAAA